MEILGKNLDAIKIWSVEIMGGCNRKWTDHSNSVYSVELQVHNNQTLSGFSILICKK